MSMTNQTTEAKTNQTTSSSKTGHTMTSTRGRGTMILTFRPQRKKQKKGVDSPPVKR